MSVCPRHVFSSGIDGCVGVSKCWRALPWSCLRVCSLKSVDETPADQNKRNKNMTLPPFYNTVKCVSQCLFTGDDLTGTSSSPGTAAAHSQTHSIDLNLFFKL